MLSLLTLKELLLRTNGAGSGDNNVLLGLTGSLTVVS